MFRFKVSAFVLAFALLFSVSTAAPAPSFRSDAMTVEQEVDNSNDNSAEIPIDEVVVSDEQLEADLPASSESIEQPNGAVPSDEDGSGAGNDDESLQTINAEQSNGAVPSDEDGSGAGNDEESLQTINVEQPNGAVPSNEDGSGAGNDEESLQTINIVNQVENQTIIIVEEPIESQSNGEEEDIFRADDEVAEVNCTARATCFSNTDCGKGRCLGAFVGKCNCNACVNGKKCAKDSDCGGYQHSCDTAKGRCNCVKAHKENGFATLGDALTGFCNRRVCSGDNSTTACLGLPCHTGRCAC